MPETIINAPKKYHNIKLPLDDPSFPGYLRSPNDSDAEYLTSFVKNSDVWELARKTIGIRTDLDILLREASDNPSSRAWDPEEATSSRGIFLIVVRKDGEKEERIGVSGIWNIERYVAVDRKVYTKNPKFYRKGAIGGASGKWGEVFNN